MGESERAGRQAPGGCYVFAFLAADILAASLAVARNAERVDVRAGWYLRLVVLVFPEGLLI